MVQPEKSPTGPCPCGGAALMQCCGRFIDTSGQAIAAPTAADLMRSRYSAYVLKDEAYLRATWHSTTYPQSVILEANDETKWLGLEVRAHTQSGENATVEFVARYKIRGRAHRLHEVSRFVREEGRWWYVEGSFPDKK